MLNPFDHINDLLCKTCVHSGLCMQNLGGANLDLASDRCPHYSEAVEIPKKVWIIFDVPGFYDIIEYKVYRTLFEGNQLIKIWGESRHQKDVAYAKDFNKLVFFSEEAAKTALEKIITDRRALDEV